LVDLELKKDVIKKKISEYKDDGYEKWETFKHTYLATWTNSERH